MLLSRKVTLDCKFLQIFIPTDLQVSQDLCEIVRRNASLKVGEITLADLALDASCCHGIYFFLQEENGQKEILYIGSCVSRTIGERLTSHMEPSASGLLNCFLRRLSGISDKTSASAKDADNQVADKLPDFLDMYFVFLPVQGDAGYIRALEQTLIKSAAPQCNRKPQKPFDEIKIVYLRQI